MLAKHPEILLAPYLRDELQGNERASVQHHLDGCAQCRASVDAYSSVLSKVASLADGIKEPDWTAYNSEVWRKLHARQTPRRWVSRPALFGAIAAVGLAAAVMVAILIPRGTRPVSPAVDQLAMEDDIGHADLAMMRDYPVIQHLDLLENYEVIENLDQIAPPPNNATRS